MFNAPNSVWRQKRETNYRYNVEGKTYWIHMLAHLNFTMAQSVNTNALFDMYANFFLVFPFELPFSAAGAHTILFLCLSIFLVNKIHLIDFALFFCSCFASVNNVHARFTINTNTNSKTRKNNKKFSFLPSSIYLLWIPKSLTAIWHWRNVENRKFVCQIRCQSTSCMAYYRIDWTKRHWTQTNFKCLPFWLCAYIHLL